MEKEIILAIFSAFGMTIAVLYSINELMVISFLGTMLSIAIVLWDEYTK